MADDADGIEVKPITISLPDGAAFETAVVSIPPGHPLARKCAGEDEPEMPERVARRWQSWETAKPEERATKLTITDGIGEVWSDDEPVTFLDALEHISPATLWAIRLELATWAYSDEKLNLN
jgi:hypothetical protein